MLLSLLGLLAPRPKSRKKPARSVLRLERLEDRFLPSAVMVVNTPADQAEVTISQASVDPTGPLAPGSAINVTYFDTSAISGSAITAWHGITAGSASGEYLIAGVSDLSAALYDGPSDGTGTSMPTGFGSLVHLFGVTNLGAEPGNPAADHVQLFGEVALFPRVGFMVDGDIIGGTFVANNYWLLGNGICTYGASGNLAVGNWCYSSNTRGASTGVLYNLSDLGVETFGSFPTDIDPRAASTSFNGIWYNGGTSYTICGSYSTSYVNNVETPTQPMGHAFLVDYDSSTNQFSNWTVYDDPLAPGSFSSFVGITSTTPGVYTIAADSAAVRTPSSQGSWVTIQRNADGSFGAADWVHLSYPGLDPSVNVTRVTGVYGNVLVGMVSGLNLPFEAIVTVTPPTPVTPPAPLAPAEAPVPSVASKPNPFVFLGDNVVVHDLSTNQPAVDTVPAVHTALPVESTTPILNPPVGLPGPQSLPTFPHQESGSGTPAETPAPVHEETPVLPPPTFGDGRPEEPIVLAPDAMPAERAPELLASAVNELRGEEMCRPSEPDAGVLYGSNFLVAVVPPIGVDGPAALAMLSILGLEEGWTWSQETEEQKPRPAVCPV